MCWQKDKIRKENETKIQKCDRGTQSFSLLDVYDLIIADPRLGFSWVNFLSTILENLSNWTCWSDQKEWQASSARQDTNDEDDEEGDYDDNGEDDDESFFDVD